MNHVESHSDFVLIGAGIMSATLGTLLQEVFPTSAITVFEKQSQAGEESSHELNNAGTGHAALCELNYTSEKPDGSIDITKAVNVNLQFQESLQFWSYLVRKQIIKEPQSFIRSLPHLSMVQGKENVTYLQKRFQTMQSHPLFKEMEFSDDPNQLAEWVPLIMNNRTSTEPIAMTKVEHGTDVNFGQLTRLLMDNLANQNVAIHYNHTVSDIKKQKDSSWKLTVKRNDGSTYQHTAKFLFLGAGGASIRLLQKTGIPERKNMGGFPISGLFLVCKNPEIIKQHEAKVYGKASVGAPPMSVPHLDTRYIDGEKALLFGPFAGFSPKFLKDGSNFDLFASIKSYNLLTLLACGAKNMDLTSYLVKQVLLSKEKRIEALREFIPNAKSEDWELLVAGQRVQVIKDTPNGKGTLQFGTEVVTSKDGSVAALLGASPGASTAVTVMLQILEQCFPDTKQEWFAKIKEMIPSYQEDVVANPSLLTAIQTETHNTLGV